jgi:hypothetical protein
MPADGARSRKQRIISIALVGGSGGFGCQSVVGLLEQLPFKSVAVKADEELAAAAEDGGPEVAGRTDQETAQLIIRRPVFLQV